jgi:hypothetical protein
LPVFVWYDATYVVFAWICTGLAKLTCCHPDAVSLENVAVPSSVPVLVHRFPTCVPVFVDAL